MTGRLTSSTSYEALPPNFSVWENMMAGAFAGIAVRSPPTTPIPHTSAQAKLALGTLCHVPTRHAEGMNRLTQLLAVLRSTSADTPPSTQTRRRRPLHGYAPSIFEDREGRRLRFDVERRFKCHYWSRYAGRVLRWGYKVMTWYRSCPRPLFCDIRGSQACYGRK